MSINIPPLIESIFNLPGSRWSHNDQARVVEWLYEPAQFAYLLRFCLYYLGPQSSTDDAEDAWGDFSLQRLPSVIYRYDPARGRRFWNYLLYCLQNECGHIRKRLHKQRKNEQPWQFTLQTEESEIEFTFEPATENDPTNPIEYKDLLVALQGCLELLPLHHRKAFLFVVLQDNDYELAVKALNAEAGTIRVWVCRARAALKKCLATKGWK